MKPKIIDNQTLVKQILSGDQQAFRIFIETYQRLVAHIVFRMIPTTADREDLCQDIFLKAYQHLASFQFESKLSTWLGRIAYNTCINFLEKKRVQLWGDLSEENDSLDQFTGTEIAPDTFTEKRDISNRLLQEIEKLPLPYRTILTLYHLEEMSYQEIGEIMQLPEGTVKSYLFRARKKLKDQLMTQYHQEALSC
ncbi:sigma-70 family RNA polymerase sigma factor [candidate division KSB1 bacterium]|nr:sigma-70 family RNA polymerase sigma factor [candidate division KSB1 bacterium]